MKRANSNPSSRGCSGDTFGYFGNTFSFFFFFFLIFKIGQVDVAADAIC